MTEKELFDKYTTKKGLIKWVALSQSADIDMDFIRKYWKRLDLITMMFKRQLSEDFLEEHHEKLSIQMILKTQKVSEDFIRKHIHEMTYEDWLNISWSQNLSEELIAQFDKKVSWYHICVNQQLSEEFIEKYLTEISWIDILKYQKLSSAFLDKHFNEIREHNPHDIQQLILHQELSEEFIEKHFKELSIELLCTYQRMTETFIEKHADKLSFPYLFQFQMFSQEFIDKWTHEANGLEVIILNQNLTEEYIEKYYMPHLLPLILEKQQVSEEFLIKHLDDICQQQYPHNIIKYQKLSTAFIEKYYQKLGLKNDMWNTTVKYQKLSEEFLSRHYDEIDYHLLYKYQIVSDDFMNKHDTSAVFKKQQELCHRDSRTREEKLELMKHYAFKHRLEFNEEEGYLIAYRDHDRNRRGMFNKTIHYSELKYYRDWRCDLNPLNENSFGLGIWPKGNVKVRVDVDDWGLEVEEPWNRAKARVWGFTLLTINKPTITK